MSDIDPYSLLGVPRDASAGEVRKAYRRKSKEVHPDAGGTAEAFDSLGRAMRLLTNDKARAHYDRTGKFEDAPIDQGDTEAYQCVARLLKSILGQSKLEPSQTNLLHAMFELLDAELANGRKERAKYETILKRAERLNGRFKRKAKKAARKAAKAGEDAPKRNWMQGLIEHEIAHMHMIIANLNEQMAPMIRARELLDDYEFDIEKVPLTPEPGGLLAARAANLRDYPPYELPPSWMKP